MNKIIVITGSSTGFGALMVKTFSDEGHVVIATMRNINNLNAAAAEKLACLPGTEVVDLDVTDDNSVKSAIDGVLQKHGRIDVLINNAGIFGAGVLEAFSISQMQKIFDVNVWGALRVTNAVLPFMRKVNDGLIINISATSGRISPPLQAPYNASKFALEGFVEGAYLELIGQGVETVLIEPGAFVTEILSKPGKNADREGIQEAYGEPVVRMSKHVQEIFTKIFILDASNPQSVADVALELINMEKGTRPLRTPVDPSSNGVDATYNQVTTELKTRWLAEYGFKVE